MATPSLLFDLDGTLVDSVYQHVLAWREALEAAGLELSVWRIHRRIGMSGGLFLDALLRETGRRLSAEEVARVQRTHAAGVARQVARICSRRAAPGRWAWDCCQAATAKTSWRERGRIGCIRIRRICWGTSTRSGSAFPCSFRLPGVAPAAAARCATARGRPRDRRGDRGPGRCSTLPGTGVAGRCAGARPGTRLHSPGECARGGPGGCGPPARGAGPRGLAARARPSPTIRAAESLADPRRRGDRR